MVKDNERTRRKRVTRTIVVEGPEDWVDGTLRHDPEQGGPCLVPRYGDRCVFPRGGEVRCTMRTDTYEEGDR